jgi:hypothetical protein
MYLTAETLIFLILIAALADKYKGSIFLHQYKIVFLFFGAQIKPW